MSHHNLAGKSFSAIIHSNALFSYISNSLNFDIEQYFIATNIFVLSLFILGMIRNTVLCRRSAFCNTALHILGAKNQIRSISMLVKPLGYMEMHRSRPQVQRCAAELNFNTYNLRSRNMSTFKVSYDGAVQERAKVGIVPKPLDAAGVSQLVELLKNPPSGEEAFLLDLLANRVPPGVDEAAYVKAAFLTAVAKGQASSPLISPEYATELLGTMQGGYNIGSLIELLDDPKLGPKAADALCNTLLMFESFYDVEAKAKAGNSNAIRVMNSWANAEWFTSKPSVPEKITVTVFKVHLENILSH